MNAWDGMNRRKFPRVNYPCLVKIASTDGSADVILSHTENIGIGGVCVTLKKGLKMFSPVELELDLMDFGEHMKFQGKVVWSIRRKDDAQKKPLFYDTGIEFSGLTEHEHSRLSAIVDRLVKISPTEL